ncbi:MAG: aminopeptidase P family protein [Rickettsiaceae bacterium]|nr:MAG: aminopeptidase P family protein [Rickettsiaceae bacterium]
MDSSNRRSFKTDSIIANFKKQLIIDNLSGYIIPSTDEYLSEYTPEFAKRLEYVTGFDGSNGLCFFLKNCGLFFTDGRYLAQAKKQIDLSFFQVFDICQINLFPFDEYINNDDKIGYDPKLFTKNTIFPFRNIPLLPYHNLIDKIWQNQPNKPSSTVYLYPEQYAGESYINKLKLCRESIASAAAKYLLITATDSICWLLNLRAHDIEFSPLMLGTVLISMNELYLFTDPARVEQNVRKARPEITLLPEESLAKIITQMDDAILVDEDNTSLFITSLIKNSIHCQDPCQINKACKNKIEIEHSIKNHIKDGVALCEFFANLQYLDLKNTTEYDLGQLLILQRAKQNQYISESFPAICGYQENGAIIHYRATEKSAKKLTGSGLLLIDSGAQYLGATTDITRTISIGTPTPKEINYYTQVLRGHLALSMISFPVGTVGANLDVLARQYLWADSLDYAHSTGHGVGSFLGVHEGPVSVSLKSRVQFSLGMILSNEPGYYIDGEFGIRIENLMYVVEKANNFLKFETLSLVPYALELIDFNQLSRQELIYLKEYYHKILSSLYPSLSDKARQWLLKECNPVIDHI